MATQAEKIKKLEEQVKELQASFKEVSSNVLANSENAISETKDFLDKLQQELKSSLKKNFEEHKEAFKNEVLSEIENFDFDSEEFIERFEKYMTSFKASEYYKENFEEQENAIPILIEFKKETERRLSKISSPSSSKEKTICVLVKKSLGFSSEPKESFYNGTSFVFMDSYSKAKKFNSPLAASEFIKKENEDRKEEARREDKKYNPLKDVEIRLIG